MYKEMYHGQSVVNLSIILNSFTKRRFQFSNKCKMNISGLRDHFITLHDKKTVTIKEEKVLQRSAS